MTFEATKTTNSLCNSLVDKYWKMIEPVHKIRDTFVKTLNDFETRVANIASTGGSTVATKLEEFEQKTKNIIPEDTVDAVREVQIFTKQCDCFFGAGESEESAVSSVLGGLLGIYDQMDDYLGQLDYPEVEAGAVGNTLRRLLSGASIGLPGGGKIAEILDSGYCIYSCLNALCPSSDGSEVNLIKNDLDALWADFKLNSNGDVDFDSIFESSGTSETDILNIKLSMETVAKTEQEAARGISNSVNAIKDAIKGGLF